MTGSALLGAGASNADRVFEKLFQADNQIGFRVNQIKEYFQWLRNNNALEKKQITEGSFVWERNDALIATNKQNDVELVIPYRPEVKYLEVIGVRGPSAETTAIRLVSLRAELHNVEKGIQSRGLEFFSTNIFEAERLIDLPSVEWGFHAATSMWSDVAKIGMNPSALDGLRFQIVFNWPMVADTIPFVDDADIFLPSNRALAPWSESRSRFDLLEIVTRQPHLRQQDISEIASVGLAEDETSRKFNFYLI